MQFQIRCNVVTTLLIALVLTVSSGIHSFQLPSQRQSFFKNVDVVERDTPIDPAKEMYAWKKSLFYTTTTILSSSLLLPTIVRAIVEDDNYEYGAVDAPIGIAVGGGLLAILTALLPIALKGGEEAFEEIKDRDSDTFGKRNTDLLSKKKK